MANEAQNEIEVKMFVIIAAPGEFITQRSKFRLENNVIEEITGLQAIQVPSNIHVPNSPPKFDILCSALILYTEKK